MGSEFASVFSSICIDNTKLCVCYLVLVECLTTFFVSQVAKVAKTMPVNIETLKEGDGE